VASSDASAAAPHPEPQLISNREPRATADQEPSLYRASSYERNLKDASITIRMSKAECAQLHRRAAEAGLTISAYLRSCTFEAESLRAMVKDTLAQLSSVTAQAKPADSAPSRFRSLLRWLARLFTPWHGSQRVASA
jgi:predicted DNA binding CopG/RHH family protein